MVTFDSQPVIVPTDTTGSGKEREGIFYALSLASLRETLVWEPEGVSCLAASRAGPLMEWMGALLGFGQIRW